MEQQQWMNLFLFFAILLGSYFLYRYLHDNNYLKNIEGLENNEPSGIAGGAETYDTKLLENITKLKDELNIGVYRQKYEDIILHLDDWTHLFMVKSILLAQSPEQALPIIAFGSLARNGLNDVLKFIDKQKSSSKSSSIF